MKPSILIIALLLAVNLKAEDVKMIFITYANELTGLSEEQTDLLMKNGKLMLEGEAILYTIEQQTYDYLLISKTYSDNKTGWVNYSFRAYKGEKASHIVASTISGTRVERHQTDFKIYALVSHISFPYKLKDSVTSSVFFIESTPEKYYEEGNEFFCFTYNLDPGKYPDGFGYEVNDCYMPNEEADKYLKQTAVNYKFTGEYFEKTK